MLNPWLFLGTVAFITSFAVSLLMTTDLGGSLIAGSSALVTALATAAAVNWYRNQATDRRLMALKHQIRLLQHRRAAEEQAVIDLSAEKERVMLSLNSMQESLRQRQLPSSNPYEPPALSWNLSTPPVETAQAEIADAEIQPEFHPASLTQFISEAAATKQKITASLNHLQSELSQLNTQVSEQRQVRDQLIQDVQHLKQQKQHLDGTTKTMSQEVEELERCRQELDQYVVYLETKKQELESGANPLQKALKQLQSQVSALQEELRSLEGQVTAKRREKEALEQETNRTKPGQQPTKFHQEALRQLETQKAQLEQELATIQQDRDRAIALQQTLPHLEQQKSQLEAELLQLRQQQTTTKSVQADLQQLEGQKAQLERELSSLKHQQTQLKAAQENLQKLEKQIRDRRQEKESLEKQITQLQAQKTALRNQPTPTPEPATQQLERQETNRSGQNGNGKPALERPMSRPKPEPIEEAPWDEDSTEHGLSDLWTDFMVQLPEYELQALKAIAHESNPTRILNRIAEDNFTTPAEMIDSINRLAEDIVGERVVKSRGSAPPIVRKEHQRTIKKLIETYEYLTE